MYSTLALRFADDFACSEIVRLQDNQDTSDNSAYSPRLPRVRLGHTCRYDMHRTPSHEYAPLTVLPDHYAIEC